MEGLSVGGRQWGGKAQGIQNIIGRHKIDGEVKNSIGNGEAQELTCMTHGHELRGGGARWRGIKERERMGQL